MAPRGPCRALMQEHASPMKSQAAIGPRPLEACTPSTMTAAMRARISLLVPVVSVGPRRAIRRLKPVVTCNK